MEKPTSSLLGAISLFAGLEPAELEDVLRIFERIAFEPGARIRRQGHPADSAFVIESGKADVVTALPGGGEAMVATLGPGSVLGEMALLESGTCSATVIAREPVTGYFIEHDGFRMLLAQRNRAAFTIQNRITLTLCRRLRDLNAKILACDTPEDVAPPLAARAGDGMRRGRCLFDFKAFLPVLPVFRRFSAAEVASFAGMTEVIEAERGSVLFRQGDAAEVCYMVVRGAVEITGARDGRRHRIGILGPGRLCGTLAMIEGQAHSMGAAARENAVLLEIGAPSFNRLFNENDRISAHFQDAINRELLQALARTNNHLTRLISQARIRGGRQEKKQVEELGRALGEQDCRAA